MSNPSEAGATEPAAKKKVAMQQKPDPRARAPSSAVIIVGHSTHFLPTHVLCENSPVIKNVISKKTHGTPRVHISGIDEKAFDVVLTFMRKGEANLDVQNVIDVYHAAHSLQMKSLELKCWSHVFDKPPYERSLPAWIWAKKMGLKKEMDQLCDFIVRNFDDIVKTESFLELNNQQVKAILQSDIIKADNELALYKAAMKWVHYDCKDRHKQTKDVMTLVRFQDMTPEELASLRQFKICPEVQKSFDIEAKLAEIGQQKKEKSRNYGSRPPKPPSPAPPPAPPTAPKKPPEKPAEKSAEKPLEKTSEKPLEKPPEKPPSKEPPLPFSEASKGPAFPPPKRAEEKRPEEKKLEPKVKESKKEETKDDKKEDKDSKDKDKVKDIKELEKDKVLKDKGDMKDQRKKDKDKERRDRKDKKDKKDKIGKPGSEVSKTSTSLLPSEIAKTPATSSPVSSVPSVTSGPTGVSSLPPSSTDSKPEKKKGKKPGEKESKDKKHKKHEAKQEKKKKGLCPWMTSSGKSSKSKSKESSKKGSKEGKRKGDKKGERKHKKKNGKSGSKESLKEEKGTEGSKGEKERKKKGASSEESTSSKSKRKSGHKKKHKKDKRGDKAKKQKGSKEKTASGGKRSKSSSKEKHKSDTIKSKKTSRSVSPTGSSSKSSKTSPAPSKVGSSSEAPDVAVSKGSVTAVHRGRGKAHGANRISCASSESSLLGKPTFKQEKRKRNHSNVPHRALSVTMQTSGNTSHSLELGPTPSPTEELAVIVLGGLAADSKGLTTESSDVYKYDSKGSKWLSAGKLPSPRYGHQAVVLQTCIYIVGGFEVTSGKCHTPTAACYKYSLAKKAWDTAPSLKNRRCHHGAAVVAGKIYAVGGQSAETLAYEKGIRFMDSVECYDPKLNKWSSITPLCCARMATNAIELKSQMYVVGGLMVVPGHKRKVCIVPDTMCFNPETETWHHKAGLPVPMCNSSLVVHKERLFAFGGLIRNNSQEFNQPLAPLGDVLEYTPSRDNWVRVSTMPTLSHGVCVASLGDDIYVLGGQLEDDAVTATKLSYRFNPAIGRWVALPSLPVRLSQACSVVVQKDSIT